MLAVCKIHAALCSKIADVHGIEVYDVRIWTYFNFGKFSDFCYTSRLSSLNGEICLKKYLPISGELSITNYLKQNAIGYQSHLTIEKTWKLKKGDYFEDKHNLCPLPKKRLVRVETNIPKNPKQWHFALDGAYCVKSIGKDKAMFFNVIARNVKFAVSQLATYHQFNFLMYKRDYIAVTQF